MSKREGQLSVPLDTALREFVEREAQREDRTEAGQVRHLITEAARQSGALAEGRAACRRFDQAQFQQGGRS